jgi:hypothetical protein
VRIGNGRRQLYSPSGGQADFARGAMYSEVGQGFVVLHSTAKDGTISKILPAAGAGRRRDDIEEHRRQGGFRVGRAAGRCASGRTSCPPSSSRTTAIISASRPNGSAICDRAERRREVKELLTEQDFGPCRSAALAEHADDHVGCCAGSDRSPYVSTAVSVGRGCGGLWGVG